MKSYTTKSNAKRAANKMGEQAVVVEIAKKVWVAFDSQNDADLYAAHGDLYCPNCNVHLSNGVDTNSNQIANGGKAYTHEFWCLGCDNGFGDLVVKAAPKSAPTGTGIKIEKARPEQNGVVRPSVGGKCRAIWDECDVFLVEMKRSPMPKEIKALAEKNEWNVNNAVIEMYQWRKFNGMTGRQK